MHISVNFINQTPSLSLKDGEKRRVYKSISQKSVYFIRFTDSQYVRIDQPNKSMTLVTSQSDLWPTVTPTMDVISISG